jgi:hypothetical protein
LFGGTREAGRRLQQLLLEGELAVLTALVESLQLEDEGKSSDEVADVLLLFLAHHDKLLPFLKLLVAREASKRRKRKKKKKKKKEKKSCFVV